MRTFAVAALLLCCACGSYKQDLQTMCDAPLKVKTADADPSMKATLMAEYISKNISTSKAKQLFSSLATVEPGQREKLLRDELAEVGITTCPMLDL